MFPKNICKSLVLYFWARTLIQDQIDDLSFFIIIYIEVFPLVSYFIL